MSAYVGISSKDAYEFRIELETIFKDCPVVEKSNGGREFLFPGGKYGFTVDWAEVTAQELYLHLRGWWSEEAVESFKQFLTGYARTQRGT